MADATPVGPRIRVGRLFAEGFAIVISILLAFAIDAAWDERQERERETEILGSLLSEFEGNRDRLPGRAALHQRTVRATTALLAAVRSVQPGQIVVVQDTLLLPTILHNTFDPSMGTLEALLQSGDLHLISDLGLRKSFAEWPARVLDATENETMLRSITAPRYRDLLMEDVDIAGVIELLDSNDISGPIRSTGTVEIHASTQMASLLGELRAWAGEASREQLRLASLADSVASMIKAELGRDAGR